MENPIVRKDDGSYVLSPSGELATYSLTLQKLVHHYMVKGMNKDAESSKSKIADLRIYLQKNFNTTDDFLDKLPEVSQFLGEANVTRFAGFIGKNFIQTLEQTQKQYYDTELSKFKAKTENPYRVPSDDLLDRLADSFQQAPSLKWPLPVNSSQNHTAAVTVTGVTTTSTTNMNDQEMAAQNQTQAAIMPSEKLLKALEAEFSAAPKLTWPLPVKQIAIADNSDGDTTPVITMAPEQAAKLPSERLLESLGELFSNSPALNMKAVGNKNPAAEATVNHEANSEIMLPVQISLRQFTQLRNNVNKFMASKDNAGYQQWLATLPETLRLGVQMMLLVNRVQKGQLVEWAIELEKLAVKFAVVTAICHKIKDEVEQYNKLLPEIQKNIQWLKTQGVDAATAQNLYSQLVNLFENKDNVQSKQMQLKMTLLQIGNPQVKAQLQNSLIKLLDRLREIYQID